MRGFLTLRVLKTLNLLIIDSKIIVTVSYLDFNFES